MTKSRSIKASGKSKTILPDYSIREFQGLNTYVRDLKNLDDGQSPSSLNWLTSRYKDNIQLRRGSALLGQTNRLGTGRVTGLEVGYTHAQTQVPFFTYAQKILYYNSTANDTLEVSTTNILPSAASADDFSVMPYQSVAGDFVYLTSPNSSIYKIPVSNPSSVVDLKSTNFRGHAKIDSNVMFLWNRNDTYNNKYTAVLYQSVSDGTQTLSGYSSNISQTLATGDGATKTFTGTLPNSPGQSTVFNVEVAGATQAGTSVSAITMATLAKVTSAAHGLVVGQAVFITGVSGMTQINGLIGFVVTVNDANNVTISINSTAFAAYSSGGTIYGSEYFIDDKNGTLNSSAGGTGTINYATGAYTLTFITAPINSVVIYTQYYYEGVTKSIVDFVSSPATFFNQFDGGGDIVAVFPFDQVEYCFHLLKSWYLNINATTPTNLPYRSRLGIPYLRGGFSTDDGVVFLDLSIPSQPRVQTLTIDDNSATAVVTVVPTPLSDTLDLSAYGFSQVVLFRWGDYDLMACANSLNGVVQAQNTIMFARNIYSGQWDILDYPASCLAQFNGTLIAGDSLSNNLFTLFSGTDDQGANINNYWFSKLYNLGSSGMKQFNRFVIKGLIQQTQNLDIYFSFDNGNFTKFQTISGTGSYVNLGNPTDVGSSTVGSNVVGGGGSPIIAYPYEYEFAVPAGRFEYVQIELIANSIGFVQVDELTFKDVRLKSREILSSSI